MSELLDRLIEIAEGCPDYPSLSHPHLPQGFNIGIPGVGEVPVETFRRAVVAEPALMATLVLGLELEPFHEFWLHWCIRHPFAAVEAPRGFGKSTICTTLYAILQICRNFDVRILVTSERDDQVKGFLAEIRGYLETNETLKAVFGEFVGRGKWTDHKIVINQRQNMAMKEGTVDALQMGGSVTGRHWETIIVDDPTSQINAWSELKRDRGFEYYFSTLKPCLMPGGSLQVRATRYHYDDLLGRLEREVAVNKVTGEVHTYHYEDFLGENRPNVPRDARIKVLKTSAIMRTGRSLWESRNPIDDRINADGTVVEGLNSIKRDMGGRAFGEQYLMICDKPQKIGKRETECREEWLLAWEVPPDYRGMKIVLRVDPAWTSAEKAAKKHRHDRKPDWSAIAVYGSVQGKRGEPRYYILDLEAGLWSTGELTQHIHQMATRWAERLGTRALRVGVERTGLQIKAAPDFYKTLRDRLKPHKVTWINPQMNKVAHARPFFVACENGEVRMSPDVHISGFVQQCGDFPFGARDDEIDAVAGAHRMLQRRRSDLRRMTTRGVSGGNEKSRLAVRGMSGGGQTRWQ